MVAPTGTVLRLRWWAIRTHRSVITRFPAAREALAASCARADVAVVGHGIDPTTGRTAPCPRGSDVLTGQTKDIYLAAVARRR